jgi:glycerol-3-phosphate cytidylyltransferase/D-beta-D-heptose 7-phosphate kinase/D-beta-D-heptose 1-phosphate adenosyltransferase
MKIAFISGYFNPLHGGHLDLIEGAAELGDKLIVIVNNDKQQILKKGKIILDEENRMRLMNALRAVDEVILSIDEDPAQVRTVEKLAQSHPNDELIFAQGGDRDSDKVNPEADICRKYGIRVVYGVGGMTKADSSTRINQALGHQK